MKWNALILLACCSSTLYAGKAIELEHMQEKILSGRAAQEGTPKVQSLIDNKEQQVQIISGQLVYDQHCIVCHRDGLVGAPKFQDEKDWKPRLVGKTLEDLLASSLKGLNAMPAKGTCNECSDEDLKAAIQFMMPKP